MTGVIKNSAPASYDEVFHAIARAIWIGEDAFGDPVVCGVADAAKAVVAIGKDTSTPRARSNLAVALRGHGGGYVQSFEGRLITDVAADRIATLEAENARLAALAEARKALKGREK